MNVNFAKLLMDKTCFPEEAKEFFTSLADKIIADGNEDAFDSVVDDYVRDVNTDETEVRLRAIAEAVGDSGYAYWMLLLILGAEKIKPVYDARGVSDEVFFDTFSDLRCKAIECFNIHGKWGTFVEGWYRHFFHCNIIKFGRLEYQDIVYDKGTPFVLGDLTVKKGDRILGIHIPSSGEAFTLEERLKSYKMAYDFYTRETGSKYLVCDCGSWLLYPGYTDVFPEGGGARDFQRDFSLLFSVDDDEFGDAWRVFGPTKDKDIADYPEDTRMRRAFKKHLLDGGANGYGVGMLVFDGERLLTRSEE
ncbi:MAG: DUF5596 domain-containing protein [Clostridia bacterium]|nr:DUF5596 domain-containing protein [Clostridia bacterium]